MIDTYAAVSRVAAQILSVQGDNDEDIPMLHVQRLRDVLDPRKDRLEIVHGADHAYKDPAHFETLMRFLIEFLVATLASVRKWQWFPIALSVAAGSHPRLIHRRQLPLLQRRGLIDGITALVPPAPTRRVRGCAPVQLHLATSFAALHFGESAPAATALSRANWR